MPPRVLRPTRPPIITSNRDSCAASTLAVSEPTRLCISKGDPYVRTATRYGSHEVQHVSDGPWSAYYVLTSKDQMGLVIEQDTPDGKVVVSVPLTGKRARELRRLLREMLQAAGEQVMSNVTPLRPESDER